MLKDGPNPGRTQPPFCTRPPGRVQNHGNPLLAIGYIRVSTEEQARHGVSLDAQAERIRAYATMAGLQLAGIVQDEGVSGAKRFEARPGGAEVLDAIRCGEVYHVIALKLDRLFRDAENALAQTRHWDKLGIALHVIDMGGSALNTGGAMGRAFLTIAAAFAELERNLIRERTATALRQKKVNLQVYSPTPLGYRREGKVLVADPDEAAVVARIRDLRANGLSLRAIAAELAAARIRTKTGRSWHASTIARIVQNTLHV